MSSLSRYTLVLIVALNVSGPLARAQASNLEAVPSRLGLGLGIPYGGIGLGYETGGQLSGAAGLGFAGELGWNLGGRVYFARPDAAKYNWRLTALFGTNTVLLRETQFADVIDTRHGLSIGIGFKRRNGFDFDLFFPISSTPPGYSSFGPPIKLALGWRVL